MATPGADFVTLRRKAPAKPTPPGAVEAELWELEKHIASNRDQPTSALLQQVVERVSSITLADGAAIAVRDHIRDQDGNIDDRIYTEIHEEREVICRASVGEAPDVGSRLRPDSALTRECFETGQVVVCEDTETDYRVRRATARSLRLRCAVVVPLTTRDLVLGVIEVLSSRPSAFNSTHVAGLQRIGALLGDILLPTPRLSIESEPATANVLPTAPRQSDENRPLVLVPDPLLVPDTALTPPERPISGTGVFLIVGAVILLFLLYFAVVRTQPVSVHSTPAVAPTSAPPTAAAPSAQSQPPRPDLRPAQPLEAAGSQPEPSLAASPAAASPSTVPRSGTSSPNTSLLPGAETLPSTNRPAAENQATQVIRPAVPALVIHEALPGTQVFIDDRLVASANPAGQASIPALPAGQHNLRLQFNGYQDYVQVVEIEAGKTSFITAKLAPFELPALTGLPANSSPAPVLALAPAMPTPVTSTRPSSPDFVLDRTLKAHSGWVTGIAFSPDGKRLASGSWDRTVKFWEVASGEPLNTVAHKVKEIQSLAFSPDGRWLATENSSNTATLRDSSTGQEIRSFPNDRPLAALGSNWVYSIAFSPDGRWLASGVDDKTVRLWDVKTGQKLRDLTGLHRPVIYIAFSPDGRFLATGADEKTVRIWDAVSGEEIFKLIGHKRPVYAVAFSPNGRWLASASADRTVKLWDMATGHEVRTLGSHGNVVTSLAFSPNGRWLASGSWDKTVKIWDVEAGRELQTLAGHDHPVYSVAFDSQGRWLASGSEDGTINLWRLNDARQNSQRR
jgi:hypothetical protein